MLFDTHAHYDDEAFDADRDALLTALPDCGVGLVIDPGCDLTSSRRAVELAAAYPHVSNCFFQHKKTVLCREEIYFRIFLSRKTRFRYFLYRMALYQCNGLSYIQTAHQPVLQ